MRRWQLLTSLFSLGATSSVSWGARRFATTDGLASALLLDMVPARTGLCAWTGLSLLQ
jgi:hypothetical protein